MSDVSSYPEYDLSTISSGVDYLKNGYIDYSKAVIVERALPDGYDGLKPVNRRVLETLRTSKTKGLQKSSMVSGDTMGHLHPHGDDAIYQAMVLMTDINGSCAFHTLDGHGTFGHVYSTEKAAAKRYTEVKLSAWSSEYFGEMDGINMIPNFDSTRSEPDVLPVSFPAVLVNSTSGIAVGFKCNIPSFNFVDVCNLVIEYIQDGCCHTVIAPDFVTGGYYVKNDKELMKLMKAGVAKLKLRGKCIVDGKQIHVTEIPFSKTIQRIISQVNNLETNCISNAYDADDFSHDIKFTVNCSSKNRTDEAVFELYKNTDFQSTYNADITVVIDGAPKRVGVWGLIEYWVEKRKKILKKSYECRIEEFKASIREALAFMEIINSGDKKLELVNIIAKNGRSAGAQYIIDNFTREQVPTDLVDFCSSRSLPSYHDGGKYASEYNRLKPELDRLQSEIGDLDGVILSQMNSLKSKYGSKFERRTEITTKDYIFSEDEEIEDKYVDTTPCVYEFRRTGFIKKLRTASNDADVDFVIHGTSSDTLIAFDNRGRLLRVYGQDLSLNSISDVGTYLPIYLNINEQDDYLITWIGKLDGRELMLLYKDGNVGFVNTSEWDNSNRNVKVLNRGIASSVADKLGAVLADIPEMLFVSDEEGRIAYVYTADIKRKDRTAKTRAFELIRGCLLDSYVGMPITKGILYLANIQSYHGKLKFIQALEDFNGDADDFTNMF